MNNKNIKVKVFLQLLILLSVVGVYSMAHAATVQLRVENNQSLVIETPGNCGSGSMNGCVRASGRAPINFNLVGERGCSGGGQWGLDYIALGNSKGQSGNISAVAASDFGADQGSGRVTASSSAGNHIAIRNNNTQAYEVWYTVYASCPGGGTIKSDPRIINDGSGHN